MGKKPAQAAATRQKLIDAFWDLYTHKGVEHISIKEITDRAGCNRGTFYLYFKDIYDILNQVEDMLIPQWLFPPVSPDEYAKMTIRQMIGHMAAFFEQNRRYASVLLGDHGDPQFARRLKEQYLSLLSSLPRLGCLEERARPYFIEYCTSGVLAMVRFWLNNDPQLPIEEFILTAIRVILPESAQSILDTLDSPVQSVLHPPMGCAVKMLEETAAGRHPEKFS